MMLAVITPVVANLEKDDPIVKGMMLAIPFAANLGGMGTIIGSPPNAIAAGAIANIYPINFAEWMLVGLPPAILLGAVAWFYILKQYPSKENEIDLTFSLNQNYPNPFNPSTTIEYSIPGRGESNSSHVKLAVYDVLGREVAVIVNQVQTAGKYAYQFNAENLPSGIYFSRLTSKGYTKTISMQLIK